MAYDPLPEGNTGIVSQYTNDVGLINHPDVILYDDWESYNSIDEFVPNGPWDTSYFNRELSSVAYTGTQSHAMFMPNNGEAAYAKTWKKLQPSEEIDVVFLRYYTKYNSGYDMSQAGSPHNGCAISADYDWAGNRSDGYNHWLVGIENSSYRGEAQPGYTHAYVYHPDQRSGWGDHWFSDGLVIPDPQIDFGADFVPMPNHNPTLDVWYCFEVMVLMNTPGLKDGRVAVWIDGALIADWQNIRFREVNTLAIDRIDLNFGANSNPGPTSYQYFDNTAIATSYIGPMNTGAPQNPWKSGTLRRYDGSSWKTGTLRRWDGSSWKTGSFTRYDGS